MQDKHTPEQWLSEGRTIYALRLDPRPERKRPPQEINVFSAAVQNDNRIASDAELDANVRLMKAAPLMLEALRGIVDWMPVPRDSAHPGRAAIRKAHEAIRAATGEDA